MVASAFDVVADPTRRQILDLLRERRRAVGELVEALSLAQPTVSKHLKVLKDAGLVAVEQQANRRFYELRAQPLAELDAWLGPYRAYWEHRFDLLERHLDTLDAPHAPGAGPTTKGRSRTE